MADSAALAAGSGLPWEAPLPRPDTGAWPITRWTPYGRWSDDGKRCWSTNGNLIVGSYLA